MTNGMFGAKGTGDTSGYGGLVRQAVNSGSSERPYGSYFDEVADAANILLAAQAADWGPIQYAGELHDRINGLDRRITVVETRCKTQHGEDK